MGIPYTDSSGVKEGMPRRSRNLPSNLQLLYQQLSEATHTANVDVIDGLVAQLTRASEDLAAATAGARAAQALEPEADWLDELYVQETAPEVDGPTEQVRKPPRKKGGPTVFARVYRYVLKNPGQTATQTSRALSLKPGTVSSVLVKHSGYHTAVFSRAGGFGPRGGYIYRVLNKLPEYPSRKKPVKKPPPPATTSWERLLEDD